MMLNSKPVKNYKSKDWGKLEPLREKINDVRRIIRRPFRDLWRIKLTWDWFWNVLRHDFDWDHGYIWRILQYKMKRVLVALENGHLCHNKEDLKALKECIAILERLTNKDHESYFEPAFRPHNKKWGKMKTKTIPQYKDGKVVSHLWKTWRPKAKTEKQKKQERKEFLEACKKEEDLRNADRKRLYDLMYKHELFWWD